MKTNNQTNKTNKLILKKKTISLLTKKDFTLIFGGEDILQTVPTGSFLEGNNNGCIPGVTNCSSE